MFSLTEEQGMLKDMLSRCLANTPTDLWQELAELGVIGALFTEEEGGFGGTGADIAVVFEELGRADSHLPLNDCALLPGLLLVSAGREISKLLTGDVHYAVAHLEIAARYDLDCVATKFENGVLNGEKCLVTCSDHTDIYIASAQSEKEGDISLYLVPADSEGLEVQSYSTIAGGVSAELTFSQTPAELLMQDALPAIESAWSAGLLAQSADTLGAMEQAAAMTVEYLKIRHQFDRPIGSFQALGHRLADMMLALEQARSAVSLSAIHLDHPPSERDLYASACKNLMGRVGRTIAEESIQLHGGIGMTEEYKLGAYAKRIIMADHLFGDTDHHLERYIELCGERF